MTKRFRVIEDGEWVKPTEDHKQACCDCGLVHKMEFTTVNGQVFYRATRDNRATANVRRGRGIYGFERKTK